MKKIICAFVVSELKRFSKETQQRSNGFFVYGACGFGSPNQKCFPFPILPLKI
jgi:hypothetical protein